MQSLEPEAPDAAHIVSPVIATQSQEAAQRPFVAAQRPLVHDAAQKLAASRHMRA